jgi:probable F420-dependent oxidoreductase
VTFAIGLSAVNVARGAEPDVLVRTCELAEAAGLDSVWVADHIVLASDADGRVRQSTPYPFAADGRFGVPAAANFPDPFVWLAFAAARTRSIALGTGTLVLPQREPILVAKQAATLDLLSGGRLRLGIGVGWYRDEFEVLGASWADRGRRTDEYIAAMRALWAPGIASFEGEFVSFTDVECCPKPLRHTIPLIVTGGSRAAARRAGRVGDGFYPHDSERLPELLDVVRQSAVDAGRDPGEVEIIVRVAEDPLELTDGHFARWERLGVERLLVSTPKAAPDPTALARSFERYRERLIEPYGHSRPDLDGPSGSRIG